MRLTLYDNVRNSLRRYLRSVQLDTDRRFLLEMNSSGEMRITGITDIKEYDEVSILVVSRDIITEIRGNSLMLNKFSDSEIFVAGQIDSINFVRR